MFKTFVFTILAALTAYFAFDLITTHVMVVSGLDMLGCATNRCVSVNDTTILIK